jgi:hypothetical protein
MPPWLSVEWLTALTPSALLSLGVLLIFTGKLRPKSAIDEIRQDRDARIAEAKEQIAVWREAYRISESARDKSAAALAESLEGLKLAEDALRAFRSASATHQGDA